MNINERFSGIVSNNLYQYNYVIFGCGAIGSNIGLELARLNVTHVLLIDNDIVSVENIGVSAYDSDDIEQAKTIALRKKMIAINPAINVTTYNKRITKRSRLKIDNFSNSILFFAFDSMSDRKMLAEKYIPQQPHAIIDTRMGSEILQIYTLQSPSIEKYKEFWYPDRIADQEPCNAKATPYCAATSGSMVSNLVKRIANDEPVPVEFLFDFKKMYSMVGNN